MSTPAAWAQQPITFRYIHDDLGQLVKAVDSTGTMIEYVDDETGNMREITVSGRWCRA